MFPKYIENTHFCKNLIVEKVQEILNNNMEYSDDIGNCNMDKICVPYFLGHKIYPDFRE
jgi:hypothetical protein